MSDQTTLGACVRATGLGHRFGQGPWLFRGVDLTLLPGIVHALTGPSGSGKSTLLGLLAGWVVPAEGTVERLGVSGLQWVLQSPHGVAMRTALDHVTLPMLASGASRGRAEHEAGELLDRFGLGDRADARFRELSGGEAQRLMLARAVAARPSLLLVDEPTAQLDQHTSRSVSRVIRELATAHTVVVVATHDPMTQAACDKVIDLAAWGLPEDAA